MHLLGRAASDPVSFSTGSERMLAKVAAEHYPTLRGREGERIRISWEEEDVQLLDA